MRAVVYGSRSDGHAGVVVELFGADSGLELVGLLDDRPENRGNRVAGLEVIGDRGALGRLVGEGVEAVVLGFGVARGRAKVVEAVEAAGLALPVLIHPSAHVTASATLAAGCQVLPNATVGAGASLGRGVLINSGAIVEHDARLADAVVIDPGAVLAGRVTVECESEVGSGAVIRPDVCVGGGAVVGAGAAVVSDVAAGSTVVGVPARPLRRAQPAG
ncbi:MAG TPA: NeuD/PglB/VioB family sugar acetyltransferase [Thermoleophilaceae bacterium]|nr:NeuD/PglB/VioB family sugar acetyltransferase [Thermoleophilaceae bacterium]